VTRLLFSKMILVLEGAERLKKKFDRPHSLALEDQLLLILKYLRSNSIHLELSAEFAIVERNANRTIQKIEDWVIQYFYYLKEIKRLQIMTLLLWM